MTDAILAYVCAAIWISVFALGIASENYAGTEYALGLATVFMCIGGIARHERGAK